MTEKMVPSYENNDGVSVYYYDTPGNEKYQE